MKRSSLTRCGAACSSHSRSRSDSRTSGTSYFSRYFRPPWIILLDHDEVPEPMSPLSSSSTRNPRNAASQAMPAPFTPPPTMTTSKPDRV